MQKVSIIIPTYNEAKNLPLLIEEIYGLINKQETDIEFIIVDDNSPDGTGRVAEGLSRQYPIKVIHRPESWAWVRPLLRDLKGPTGTFSA